MRRIWVTGVVRNPPLGRGIGVSDGMHSGLLGVGIGKSQADQSKAGRRATGSQRETADRLEGHTVHSTEDNLAVNWGGGGGQGLK